MYSAYSRAQSEDGFSPAKVIMSAIETYRKVWSANTQQLIIVLKYLWQFEVPKIIHIVYILKNRHYHSMSCLD